MRQQFNFLLVKWKWSECWLLISQQVTNFLFSGELIQLAAEGELRMTETNTPKSAKKPRWTSLEIGLITIVSLLFIVIVALIILFATQKTGEWCKEKTIILKKKDYELSFFNIIKKYCM